jgi:hypothetical protein
MAQAIITLVLSDSDTDTATVSVFVSVSTGDTVDSLSEDYAHVWWDVVRPLVNGVLVDVIISLKPDFSAWDNNTFAVISDIEEKARFSLRVCGQNRPVRLTLPTALESIFENSGAGKFVDVTNVDYIAFSTVIENGIVDGGIDMTDSHGTDICGIYFGEQFFGKG